MKFFGTNSGASGDKVQDEVFPQAASSSGVMDNMLPLVFGVNGCVLAEKEQAGESTAQSTGSTVEPTHNTKTTF